LIVKFIVGVSLERLVFVALDFVGRGTNCDWIYWRDADQGAWN